LAREKKGGDIRRDGKPSQLPQKRAVIKDVGVPSERSGSILTEEIENCVKACFRQFGKRVFR
jgi:hypothetical protein